MGSMTHSMAQAASAAVPLDVPRWRNALGWTAAVLLGSLFLLSGLWKITDPEGAAIRMAQALLPESLTLAAALAFGIAETVGGVMLFVPRLRRWGAVLTGALLLAFLIYFAINYNALRGADCSCFPWLKRVVGPGFFVGDGLMLGLAAIAGAFSFRPRGLRELALIAGAVTVFAFVSWGVSAVRQTGAKAPDSIVVDGRSYSLQSGKILLFYFDPECMHCFHAAEKMARFHWGATRVIGVPITHPQFAPGFMTDTGMTMPVSSDLEKLRAVFPYTAIPTAIALENGRQKAALVKFEDSEPAAALKGLGFIE
jgi:uncharacterized membrane protein YphA (DoxX/SURF4 family)